VNGWRSKLLLCLILSVAALAGYGHAEQLKTHFAALDIILESAEPVAAWQFELHEASGRMRVVGVENGDSPAFTRAPYHDRRAVSSGGADRVIVADFSLLPEAELPVGKVRMGARQNCEKGFSRQ
jgi:hypothetical protein